MGEEMEDMVVEGKREKEEAYIYYIPDGTWNQHFSSILLSSDVFATSVEVLLLLSLFLLGTVLPEASRPQGSMGLQEVAVAMVLLSLLRRLYNSYLEAVYCSFPSLRTQPAAEHALKADKDIVGREREQLEAMVLQDRLTLISQFLLECSFYFLVPGYYPASAQSYPPMYLRLLTLLANHYLMSFGMYWMHRALHVNPWLWRNIHSLHHWAKHPLSRTTYQDHWLDNFGNAIVGHFFAQVLIPLDHGMFWLSRGLRVCESLEKHSGVSCLFNLVHSVQRWLPFAQMPHHHDWHHEGHKGCNYTFTSLGGLWDCVFGTRKTGRHPRAADTREDRRMVAEDTRSAARMRAGWMDHPYLCLSPIILLGGLTALKLYWRTL